MKKFYKWTGILLGGFTSLLLLANVLLYPSSMQKHNQMSASRVGTKAKNPAGKEEPGSKAIDEYVAARMRAAQIPGMAVVVVKGDQIVYANSYGRADPAGRPVTLQTPFLIGSITKPFTALAVMQLVEAGKVELDAPVQRYLPWFRTADPKASAQITVRHLLYQTSGMLQPKDSQTMNDTDDQALERAVRSLSTMQLNNQPGETFAYSNGNYRTLGMIIQVVSEQSYEDYVREHIFSPLDMRNSYLSQDEALQNGMGPGYRWWFGIPFAVTLPFPRADLPGGYIIASAEDMAHFMIAEMNGGRYQDRAVLSPEGIAMTHIVPPNAYGAGWESVELNGRTLIIHDGGVPNFEASILFDPETRVGVYVAANVCGALDTLSSPSGPDPRDGPTVRVMGQSIFSIVTQQPMPDQGLRHERLYLAYDLVLLGLSTALIMSLVRIPVRHRRLAQRSIAGWRSLIWRGGLTTALHFALPAAVLYLALEVPLWKTAILYQPDLAAWLEAASLLLSVKGVLELALLWRVFRQAPAKRLLQLV